MTEADIVNESEDLALSTSGIPIRNLWYILLYALTKWRHGIAAARRLSSHQLEQRRRLPQSSRRSCSNGFALDLDVATWIKDKCCIASAGGLAFPKA